MPSPAPRRGTGCPPHEPRIARLGNAISRLAIAEYATRDPKPVIKYGQEWHPPLDGGEKLVHYIWRHRPADFEERYMAKIDDPESLPWNIDRHVEADYRDSLHPDRINQTADGKYLPPPLPEWRREKARRRSRRGLRPTAGRGARRTGIRMARRVRRYLRGARSRSRLRVTRIRKDTRAALALFEKLETRNSHNCRFLVTPFDYLVEALCDWKRSRYPPVTPA